MSTLATARSPAPFDLLMRAVVDISLLVATCHALKFTSATPDQDLQRELRGRLRRDMRRGTLAYLDALSRIKRGAPDDALLARCRVAAEAQMPRALAHQALLGHIMGSEAGALEGVAAARQDLWRLAHLAVQLSIGRAWLEAPSLRGQFKQAGAAARRLRRRLRKALVAYAQATLRGSPLRKKLLVRARQRALAEIGVRGLAEARRLGRLEGAGAPASKTLRRGVSKTLQNLFLDWGPA